jgi:hypothetical protein
MGFSANSEAAAPEICPSRSGLEVAGDLELSIHSATHFRCSSISSDVAPDPTWPPSWTTGFSLGSGIDDAQQLRRWAPNKEARRRNANFSDGLDFGSVAEFDEAIGCTLPQKLAQAPSAEPYSIRKSKRQAGLLIEDEIIRVRLCSRVPGCGQRADAPTQFATGAASQILRPSPFRP